MEDDLTAEPGAQAFVGVEEFFDFVGVPGDDHHDLVGVVLHVAHDFGDDESAEVIGGFRVSHRIHLVDENCATAIFFEQFVEYFADLLFGSADLVVDEVRSTDLQEMRRGEQSCAGKLHRDRAGDRGLSGSRGAHDLHVQGTVSDLHAQCRAAAGSAHRGLQFVDLKHHMLDTDELGQNLVGLGVELIAGLLAQCPEDVLLVGLGVRVPVVCAAVYACGGRGIDAVGGICHGGFDLVLHLACGAEAVGLVEQGCGRIGVTDFACAQSAVVDAVEVGFLVGSCAVCQFVECLLPHAKAGASDAIGHVDGLAQEIIADVVFGQWQQDAAYIGPACGLEMDGRLHPCREQRLCTRRLDVDTV
ncbi:Uncharacterised protein [Mycobacteroides abscessus subsp. abscessus]|nr:Uncharacterised protein [Mycobacteroides abscessus subsp. abscessus]